jgi:hypothetical protein
VVVSLPSRVKIGAHWYEVICDEQDWKETEHTEKNSSLWGCTDNRNLKIHLRPNVPPTQQADTMLHETFHVLFAHQNLPMVFGSFKDDADMEEILASIMTPLLHAFLVENPELVAYLQDPTPAPPSAVNGRKATKK